jgi:Sulfotransferase domain
MEARALIIEEKRRTFPIGVVRPSDFRVRDGGAADPRLVLQQPNLTLYCLDFENQQALFVETPPECDLSRAPFLYQAQYDAARRLVQVPYETLHRLAAEVGIDPSCLILIYSVGRCGSTLVSHAFNEVEGVESISEPDVFTQMLGHWGARNLEGTEKAELLKSCTLIQCAPGRSKGATAWALKFRSMVMETGDLFYSVFPEAKVIFLYRNAEPWARSFLRLARVSNPAAPIPLAGNGEGFRRSIPRLEARATPSALELLACMWLSVMEKCLEMQRRGVPMFVARYEELNAAPRDVLAEMFAYCGLSANAVGNLDTVLEQDSQAGSPLSRASVGEAPVQVSREHVDKLCRLIGEFSQELTADTILPGTYFPQSNKQ